MNLPDKLAYKAHEVEMNVGCPFCSKTNAIVWPHDESFPLVLTADNQISERQRSVESQILHVAK